MTLAPMTQTPAAVDRILAVAEPLFLAASYADVTMDQIARKAGLTKGGLYHHFVSKEGLYLEMMQADLVEKQALFSAAAQSSGDCRSRLRCLTQAFFQLPDHKRQLISLIRRNSNVLGEAARMQLISAYQQALPDQILLIIKDAIGTGEIQTGDARLLAWSFVALVETAISAHGDRVLEDPSEKLDFVLDLFFRGAQGPQDSDLRQALANSTGTDSTPVLATATPASYCGTGVFPEWQGQSLDDMLLACRDLVEDGDFPTVQRWRDGGGRVLGHFQVYFPEEIAHAAGLLPFKLRGAPVEPDHADSRFGSYLCSILKTSLELVLSGRVELDMFVTHPICDAARNLAAVWERNSEHPCQILYLPQNANSADTARYLRNEYARLMEVIEQVAGTTITEDDLRRSIELFNRNRALIRQLYDIKRETPWLLNAEDAYCLVSVGGMVPREEHNALLETVLPMIRERADSNQEDRVRVVFEGGFCEQPPLDLIRMVGRSCYVVDDDFLIGLRWILEDVPSTGDPLQQLAEAYLEKSSYSPVQHDLRKPKEKMLKERISSSKADAAIITAAKMCEPGLEEQVCYTRSLDEDDIGYFVSEFEENMTSFDHLGLQIETFMENLMYQ